HRMPHDMIAYGEVAAARGLRVIIAGAGGAAHLPGMLASVTPLPVVGVPVPLKHLDGMDSLLSLVPMPAGVPGAAVGGGAAGSWGRLAVSRQAASERGLRAKMRVFQQALYGEGGDRGERRRKDLRRRPGPSAPGPLVGGAGRTRRRGSGP